MINIGDSAWVCAHDLSENTDTHFMACGKVISLKQEGGIQVGIKYHPDDVKRTGNSTASYGIEGVFKKVNPHRREQ